MKPDVYLGFNPVLPAVLLPASSARPAAVPDADWMKKKKKPADLEGASRFSSH